MAWNPKTELVKAAAKIAKEEHPEGFNKAQLIESSKKVNGGFSTNPHKKVKTHEDINNMANHMSEIDGGYPRGMSGCFVVGINGGCGLTCPVFLDGECDELGELTKEELMESDQLGEEQKKDLAETYF